MNKIILTGRTTKDVELRATSSGVDVASFTLAVNRDFKNAEGGYDADFINCIAFQGLAKTLNTYVKKGNKIAVEGRLQQRSYDDKDGNKKYVFEVVVSNIEFLENKSQESTTTEPVEEVKFDEDVFALTDDDLPF